MRFRVVPTAVLIALTPGCSDPKPPQETTANKQAAESPLKNPDETITTDNGKTYTVKRYPIAEGKELPMNSDLKMVDGNIARYAIEPCLLSSDTKFAATICDVYVQPDADGSLTGYAFVYKNPRGVFFSTATQTNLKKEKDAKACFIGGPIYDEKSDYQQQMIADPTSDFQGRYMYYRFKNGAGDDLVAPYEPDKDTALPDDASMGVWYLTKDGNKLRIQQERWNYCYKSPDINVDEVFYRVASLKLKTHP